MNNLKTLVGVSIILVIIVFASQSCYYDKYEDLNPKDTITSPVDSTDTITSNKVKYTSDVKAVFDTHCISCHSPTGTNQSPFLNTYSDCKNAVQTSDVLDRINGIGTLMPDGGPKMEQSKIDLIQQWKDDGYQQ